MARETINGISVPIPGTGEPADFQGDLRRFATDLSASYVVFRDQNGAPLPPGSITTITVNTETGEIDDITFQEA